MPSNRLGAKIALPVPTPPVMRVRIRQFQTPAASVLIAPALASAAGTAQSHAANWSALWTEDGGIANCRAMARRPKPFALSFLTSAARPLMVAGRPS